ncbi:MAG: Nif3-like dinuclear metal center hexameric protein [Gemmatimonadales bacterium]
MTLKLGELVAALDVQLRVVDVPDHPNALNGLQVDAGRQAVSKVAVAVDACLATIEAAAKSGAEVLIVHHGLFWGGAQPITGRHGLRLRRLIESGISLYSAHLPLDLHPELGNNAILARELGLTDLTPFGTFEGNRIGFGGAADVTLVELANCLTRAVGATPRVIATGPERVRRVAVVTGGGSSCLKEAVDEGYDTLVTGEAPHHAYFDAEEWQTNLVLGGHYATETIGVKALGRHIETQFGVPWVFLDHPTGL